MSVPAITGAMRNERQRGCSLLAGGRNGTVAALLVDGLGFTIAIRWVVAEKIRWCRLEIGNAAIMLQDTTKTPSGGTTSVVFICEDAVTLYREFLSRGLQPSLPQVGNGMWVTSLVDPDGYKIDFTSLTDAPEESFLEP